MRRVIITYPYCRPLRCSIISQQLSIIPNNHRHNTTVTVLYSNVPYCTREYGRVQYTVQWSSEASKGRTSEERS